MTLFSPLKTLIFLKLQHPYLVLHFSKRFYRVAKTSKTLMLHISCHKKKVEIYGFVIPQNIPTFEKTFLSFLRTPKMCWNSFLIFLEISYLDILILCTLKWRQIFKLILRTITIRHNTSFSVQVTFSFTFVYSVWDNSKFYTQLWFKYVFCFDG